MARFAKPLQGSFSPVAKHPQKHKNRPEIGRFSHFNPSAEMHPFSLFSASKAPQKWLCDAICRKKQLFAGSFGSRSHSFCSFTVEYAAFVEKYCGQNAASGFFDSVLRDGEDQVRHLQDMPFGACAAMDARHAAAFEAKYGHLGLRFIPFAPGRYDVLRADAGKAAGVGRLLERLGISWAETAAFGDGENDAELLEAAGFAVAMEGGAQSLLPLADAVAPAAALDGAAAAVREYLLE